MFSVQGKNYKKYNTTAKKMGYTTKVNREAQVVGVIDLSKEQQLRYLEIKELLALAYLLDMKVLTYR